MATKNFTLLHASEVRMAQRPTMDKPINEYFIEGAQFIRVRVGPTKKCWLVNAEILYKRAPYFNKLGEQENQSPDMWVSLDEQDNPRSGIWLRNDDPVLFAHIFDWIHGSCLVGEDLSLQAVRDSPISSWCKLHILAVKLGVRDLAAHALTMYLRTWQQLNENWIPNSTEIIYGYATLGPGTLFRKILAHHMAKRMFSTKFADWESWGKATSCCPEFNLDVARALKDHTWSAPGDCDVEVCAVHEPLPHPFVGDVEQDVGRSDTDEDLPMTERGNGSEFAILEDDDAKRSITVGHPVIIDCDTPIPSVEGYDHGDDVGIR